MSDLSSLRAQEVEALRREVEEGRLELRRAERRRLLAERIGDDAPREGVAIFRKVDQAILVALHEPGETSAMVDASLDELELLLDTAGGETVGRVIQRRDTPDVATFIGRGKVAQLRDLVKAEGADAVVFDQDLSPAQQRNLEERLGVKVLDRTIVILDIFAQHASSQEGAAQVELAQLQYLLPRLRGWGDALSRQAGGIGTRGPGESQLEVDRRKLNRRITKLKRDLKDAERIRRVKSKQRRENRIPSVALVGYTNAGKSTLMNALTGADVLVADQLFATLDTTARQLHLPDGRTPILTDTVGFVRKLPTPLVEAFKSTLEDTITGDLLLHVVDASHPEAQAHMIAVDEVLEEIGADQQPRILVLNKADLADPADIEQLRNEAVKRGQQARIVSAVTRQGLDDLITIIANNLPPYRRVIRALIPYTHGQLVALAHKDGEVLERDDREDGTWIIANVPQQVGHQLRPYLESWPWGDEDEAEVWGEGA